VSLVAAVDRLPPGSNLIHIGPQKTGSTALQSALNQARDELRAHHHVIYPGPYRKPVRAIEAGLAWGYRRGAPRPRRAAWRQLLAQLEHGDDTIVCVSHEGLANLEDARIDTVVTALGGTKPHIVLAARRYDAYFPSQWQERIKAGKTFTFDEWVRTVLERRNSRIARNVWVPHDTPALVERWAKRVGLENVTVIAGDEKDRRQLLDAFECLLGVPSGLLEPLSSELNRSLSYPEVELLRAVNDTLRDIEYDDSDWHHLFSTGMVPFLAKRPYPKGDVRIPSLPAWARPILAEISARREAWLEASGVRIVGDLADLRIVTDEGGAPAPAPPTKVSIDTATAAIEGLVRGAVAARRKAAAGDGEEGGRQSERG
jgi:hypothetical protein